MQKLRVIPILILLLCVAVPTAGWASLMNGAHCKRTTPYEVENLPGAGHDATVQSPEAAHGRGHDASGEPASPGSPNDSNACKCGCNNDVCASSCDGAAAFSRHGRCLLDPGKQIAGSIAPWQLAIAHGRVSLRPPISQS